MKTKEQILRPTEDRRHLPQIREGKLSAEIFTKDPKRRQELGLPIYRVEE